MSYGKKAYLSCYSCPNSTILANEKQKLVECGLYAKTFEMKPGMSYPTFCEIRAINHKGEK